MYPEALELINLQGALYADIAFAIIVYFAIPAALTGLLIRAACNKIVGFFKSFL